MNIELFEQVLHAYKQHIETCFTWQGMKEQELATALATNDLNQVLAVSTAFGE